MAQYIQKNIDIDKSNDFIAVWHDESHLNRYHVYNNHLFKNLNPDYCYPEGFHEKIDCKPIIIALLKDHNKVRNLFTKKKVIINMMGGLGNLLYQVAFGLAISKKFDMELFVKDKQTAGDTLRASSYNYHLLDNIPKTKVKGKEITYERGFSLDKINSNNDIELEGYFQKVSYFKEYFSDLLELLDFSVDKVVKKIYDKIEYKYRDKKLISLHIRGTDYIHNSHFYTILDEKYYSSCINKINDSNCIYCIFTDDISHSTNILNNMKISSNCCVFIKNMIDEYLEPEYKYLLNNNSELELLLMSKFEILICANSTFSMWGGYLSKAEQIYVPSKWFEKSYFNQGNLFNIDDFILNDKYIIVQN